jgi:uncharacterized membrane protein YdjX (TVP38/TMEM64 family)
MSPFTFILSAFGFILLRAGAIVIAPIPGAVLDIPAVQIFGWKVGLCLAEVGIMIGASVSFWIARTSRRTKLFRWVDRRLHLDEVRKWETRLPASDQLLGWIALRLPTNVAFDYISYAAGLTNCSYSIFFWSTLIGSFPGVFLFFLLSGVGFKIGTIWGWLVPLALLAAFSLPVIFRLKQKIKRSDPTRVESSR